MDSVRMVSTGTPWTELNQHWKQFSEPDKRYIHIGACQGNCCDSSSKSRQDGYLSRIENLSREGMVTQKFEDRFIVKAIWAGLVFSFFVGHFVSLGNLEPKPRWRFRVPRKLQRKWEGIVTLPSISKGKYPRKFNMKRDGPK